MSFPALELSDPKPELLKFYEENILTWADEEIAESMRSIARAANMSQNYIDHIIVVKIGPTTVKVANTHEHAKKIEYGIKPHVITTKGGTGGRNSPKALKIPAKYAGGILAKVNHPGTRPMLIMTKGWEIGLPKFRARAKAETALFKERNS